MTGGVGSELKLLLRRFHIYPTPDCPCDQRAFVMDCEGPDWCSRNVELIVDWLKEEASHRNLPFLRPIGRVLVRRAIRNARAKERMLQP